MTTDKYKYKYDMHRLYLQMLHHWILIVKYSNEYCRDSRCYMEDLIKYKWAKNSSDNNNNKLNT